MPKKMDLPIRVKVQSGDGASDWGLGTYVADVPIEMFGRVHQVPKIELDNGTVVYGYQCWWEPVAEQGGNA